MAARQLFGEFLVQKNLLKANAILGLLIEQLRSQPTVGEIVFQNSLLSEQQQLEIFRTQCLNGWDYQQACVALGYWNEELAKQIFVRSAKSRMPIGQLIVAKGLMSFGDLTKALDEFVGICESESGVLTKKYTPSQHSSTLSSHASEIPVTENVCHPAKAKNSEKTSSGTNEVSLIDSAEIDGEIIPYKNISINRIDAEILSEFFDVMLKTRRDELVDFSILDYKVNNS